MSLPFDATERPRLFLITGIMAAGKSTVAQRLGLWLDTSRLTADETVDAILADLDQAQA